MSRLTPLLIGSSLSLLIAGCASDDPAPEPTGDAAMAAGFLGLYDGDADSVLTSLVRMGAQMSDGNGGPQPMARPVGPLAASDPCITETATRITYTDCQREGYTVNGTLTRDGGQVELDITVASDDGRVTIDLDGGGTRTEDSAQGQIVWTIRAVDDEGQTRTLEITTDYDITLDGDCPVLAQIDLTYRMPPGGNPFLVTHMTIQYGPNCEPLDQQL